MNTLFSLFSSAALLAVGLAVLRHLGSLQKTVNELRDAAYPLFSPKEIQAFETTLVALNNQIASHDPENTKFRELMAAGECRPH
jgi:hypothetical protein